MDVCDFSLPFLLTDTDEDSVALHFTLSVPPTGAHDDAEICYNPRLNADRDRDLLELLPDYLCEEISFPRSHVPKFYLKVADSMSKKIVFEDE